LSGIHKRENRLEQALREIREAYGLAERYARPVHPVVIKNRAVLEFLTDNLDAFRTMYAELKSHPECDSVIKELEREIGTDPEIR
jgi:hypothetical protein